MNEAQLNKVGSADGFIAALDQSGGSTPKALKAYGVEESAYSGDAEMFDKIHEMRTRIITSPSFDGDRVLGAILFSNTMDREIGGIPTAEYLWEKKNIVPFLKIDQGLIDVLDDVQLLRPIEDLRELLAHAERKGIFGTKARSVIHSFNHLGIREVISQQFSVSHTVLEMGLMPIIEPEILINSEGKAQSEEALVELTLEQLGTIHDHQQVMLKLTLPETPGVFQPLIDHPRVLRVVALSGGYSREEANEKLAQNAGMIASFSRALTERLSSQQNDAEFDATLNTAIQQIYDASVAGGEANKK